MFSVSRYPTLPYCTLTFICDILLNYSWSVLNSIRASRQFYQYTVAHCQYFLSKRNQKE